MQLAGVQEVAAQQSSERQIHLTYIEHAGRIAQPADFLQGRLVERDGHLFGKLGPICATALHVRPNELQIIPHSRNLVSDDESAHNLARLSLTTQRRRAGKVQFRLCAESSDTSGGRPRWTSWSRVCAVWSTAATTRRASPLWPTRRCMWPRRPANLAISKSCWPRSSCRPAGWVSVTPVGRRTVDRTT